MCLVHFIVGLTNCHTRYRQSEIIILHHKELDKSDFLELFETILGFLQRIFSFFLVSILEIWLSFVDLVLVWKVFVLMGRDFKEVAWIDSSWWPPPQWTGFIYHWCVWTQTERSIFAAQKWIFPVKMKNIPVILQVISFRIVMIICYFPINYDDDDDDYVNRKPTMIVFI